MVLFILFKKASSFNEVGICIRYLGFIDEERITGIVLQYSIYNIFHVLRHLSLGIEHSNLKDKRYVNHSVKRK